ncbi:SIMPL domain-containing protein [Olleya sp. YS]|uniref:SIMPL domain-containing protein n=1 Tax=Olleya sp. YS TaxID=3028318 RepID=UPI00243448E2|nr:SIMPL domain-containing protein [Olleya sp. YS]WGD33633.1 SIMPL domain-containing protein [Olleya sp. YS]
MKHFTLILFAFATLSSYSQSDSYSQSEKNDTAYLETTAVKDSLVVPDRIYLSIIVREKDTRGKESVEVLEQKMEETLKSINIDIEKQLFLSDASSNFKKYFLKKKDVLKEKVYSLLIYDAITAGKVIMELELIGVSNVFLTKTEYSKTEDLKIELKKLAVIKAKKQANIMVEPLGQKIGKAVRLSDSNSLVTSALSGNASGIVIRGTSSIYGSRAYQPISIDFEKIKIESAVSVRFELK